MRGVFRATVATIAFALCATSAAADGHVGRYAWTGLYIGGHAGGAWSDTDFSNLAFQGLNGGAFTPVQGEPTADANGFLGGGQLGYNFQTGNLVAGLEVSISGGNIDGSQINDGGGAAGVDDDYGVEINSIFQAVLRLGYASGKVLAYGKIGYASADIDSSVLDTSDLNPGAPAGSNSSSSERHGGLVLGAGLEYAVTNNIIFGIDYTYINFQEKTHTGKFFNSGSESLTADVFRDVDPDLHAVTARISYKFGSRHSTHAPLK